MGRFLFLLLAIVLTGVGFTKNCFDLFNICITITVGLVCQGHLIGIGLGTVVAVFNHCLKRKMDELAGMEA